MLTTRLDSEEMDGSSSPSGYNNTDIHSGQESEEDEISPFATPALVYSIVVISIMCFIICIVVPIIYTRVNRRKRRHHLYQGSDENDTNNAMAENESGHSGLELQRRENRRKVKKLIRERERAINAVLCTEIFMSPRSNGWLPDIEEGEEEVPSTIDEEVADVPMKEYLRNSSFTSCAESSTLCCASHEKPKTCESRCCDLPIEHAEYEVSSSPSFENDEDRGSFDRYFESTRCPICLYDFVNGDEVCKSKSTKCKHIFHRQCITKWLMWHYDCPCCRFPYIEESLNQSIRQLQESSNIDFRRFFSQNLDNKTIRL